jgi:hypothetical protein
MVQYRLLSDRFVFISLFKRSGLDIILERIVVRSRFPRHFFQWTDMSHNASHDSIAGDVHHSSKAVHKPVNRQNKGETIRSSGCVEHGIVRRDDEDQTGALMKQQKSSEMADLQVVDEITYRHGRSTNTAKGGDDHQEN